MLAICGSGLERSFRGIASCYGSIGCSWDIQRWPRRMSRVLGMWVTSLQRLRLSVCALVVVYLALFWHLYGSVAECTTTGWELDLGRIDDKHRDARIPIYLLSDFLLVESCSCPVCYIFLCCKFYEYILSRCMIQSLWRTHEHRDHIECSLVMLNRRTNSARRC